jgi:hypothetical protein
VTLAPAPMRPSWLDRALQDRSPGHLKVVPCGWQSTRSSPNTLRH